MSRTFMMRSREDYDSPPLMAGQKHRQLTGLLSRLCLSVP
jgi:hypothetical protein